MKAASSTSGGTQRECKEMREVSSVGITRASVVDDDAVEKSAVQEPIATDREALMEALVQLHCVAVTIDRLWNESSGSAAGSLSIRLGEASHSLHRALIALDDAA
jgi:D-alanine-D-alanine ligase-like ATP-grasp enzyme